ncbi:MAG: hypothetical protein JJU10_09485 [Idiomarina sp.]|nr:hypothetical protein [Idiomarina sp.]
MSYLGHRLTQWSVIGLMALLLSACGFHLRGDFQVPDGLTELYVDAPSRSQAARFLEQALELRGVEVQGVSGNIPQIRLEEDSLDRRIMSLLPSGQVAEYELIYTLPVTFINVDGTSHSQTIQLSRDYQDDPNFALAKTRELELVVSEMRRDAVQRILILMNQYIQVN